MSYLIVFVSFIYGLVCGIAIGSDRALLDLLRIEMSAKLNSEDIRNARQAYFYGVVINTVFWIGVLVFAAYQYLKTGG